MIKAKVILKDGYSAIAKNISKSAKEMKSALSSIGSKKTKIEIDDVSLKNSVESVRNLKSTVAGIKNSTVKIDVYAKTSLLDRMKNKIKSVKKESKNIFSDLRSFKKAREESKKLQRELEKTTGKRYKIKLNIEDGALKRLKNIGLGVGKGIGALTKASATAMKLGIAGMGAMYGTASAGAGMLWGYGSELQQQKVSMKHFLGGDEKKSEKYLSDLRQNANLTPFETGEVIQAGTRAIQITEGDTDKAMNLVKLAEDMAGLTPGKSISQAMEALADMQMGEFERMKEFGFKGSKVEFDKAGGDIYNMKSATGKSLVDMFSGGAEKLSATAEGKKSTIIGNIKSGLADAGLKLMDKVSPILSKLVPMSEKIGVVLPQIFDKGYDLFITTHNRVKPVIDGLTDAVKRASPAIGAVSDLISNVSDGVIPYASGVLLALGEVVGSVLTPAINIASGITKNFLSPFMKLLGSTLKSLVVPAIRIFGGALQLLTPIINTLGSVIKAVIDSTSWMIDGIGGVVNKIVNKIFNNKNDEYENSSDLQNAKSNVIHIGPSIENARRRAIEGHASGTVSFKGGLTKINEFGSEMVQLPTGSKIYPADKTRQQISKDLKLKTSKNGNVYNININISTTGEIDEDILAKKIVKILDEAEENSA